MAASSIDEILASFEGAFAEATLKAYRCDFVVYNQWCEQNQVMPFAARPEDIAAFVDYMAERSSPATARRRIRSISNILQLSDRPDPTRTYLVTLAIRRMHRRYGRAQKQAVPLTKEVLQALLAVCGKDACGQRDAVMLQLGYETMRRRSELCRFKFDDMLMVSSGKTAMQLHFCKTDQWGFGKLIPISRELYDQLLAWGEFVGGEGYILRKVGRYGNVGKSLDPSSINRRLRALQAKTNLELGDMLSGQSFRVGAALDLLYSGESLERIMLRGGWRRESSVISYLREWQDF